MPTFSNVILNDGATTPVAHTFATKTNDNGVAVYEDRSGGVPIGYGKLIFRTSETNDQRTVKADILIPILEAVAGANASGFTPAAKVAYQNIGKIEVRTSMRSTKAQRDDIVAYVKNAAAHATWLALVSTGEEISG